MCMNSPPWLLVYGVVSVGREHARSSPKCEAVLWSPFRCYYIPQEKGWGQGWCFKLWVEGARRPSQSRFVFLSFRPRNLRGFLRSSNPL